MSLIFRLGEPLGDGEPDVSQRGGAPVAHMRELPPVECAVVQYARSWCDGPAGHVRIASDFATVLDPAQVQPALDNLDDFMLLLTTGARRPLMRHALGCPCVGGDENALAQLIAAAAAQDTEDALLFASALLRGAAVFQAVRLAGALGPVFLRIARSAMRPPAPGPTRH